MKILAKLLGGSHLYGLNTPESDLDERYVYAYDDVPNIIGLDKNECVDSRDGGEDSLGYELRRYLQLLRKTNSQAVEYLYAPDKAFSILTDEFKLIRANKHRLIDSEKFYKSLKGYLFSEMRLAIGERTGKLGSKRKEALEKYGFSPKNFAHLLRLCRAGSRFFATGDFPVNIEAYDPDLHRRLMEIKLTPELFTKESLTEHVHTAEKVLDETYTKSLAHPPKTYYDHEFANKIILDTYYPILKEIKENEKNNHAEGPPS